METVRLFSRCIGAEIIKLKGTLAVVVAFAIPLFLSLLVFIIFFSEGENLVTPGTDPWLPYGNQLFSLWSGLVMILMIILQAALLTSIEHRSDSWRRLYILPIPKWMIYFSKLIAFITLNLLSAVGLAVFSLLFARALMYLRPALGFQDYDATGALFFLSVKVMLGAFCIIGLQYYFSFRSKSFVLPLVFGFFLMVSSGILNSWRFIHYVPYSFPNLVFREFLSTGDYIMVDQRIIISFLLMLVISVLGFIEIKYRDVK